MRFRIVVALAALSASGLVSIPARADESAAATTPASGGSCPAQQDMTAERASLLAKIQADIAAQQAQGGDDDVVMLNGRGYRYDSDQLPAFARDVRLLEIEIARSRAAARAAGGGEASKP